MTDNPFLGSPGRLLLKELPPMTVRQGLSVVALILAILAVFPIGPFPFIALAVCLLALANLINR